MVRVGWLGWQDQGALLAGSAGWAGRVWGHSGPGQQARLAWSAGMAGLVELGGKEGSGLDRPGGAVGAGLVGQERAGPGLSSCERTYDWFLEMCVCLRSWDVG